MKQSPIFIKAFETLQRILEHTRKFPKDQRFVMAKRIEEASLSLYDYLVYATKAASAPRRLDALHQADFHLERVKVYNRLVMKLKLLSFAQYEYLAQALDEIGRLLGGWMKSLRGSAGTARPEGHGG